MIAHLNKLGKRKSAILRANADRRERHRGSLDFSRTNYHVVAGFGYSIVSVERLDWEDKEVFAVPTSAFCEHAHSGDRRASLFSFSDAPVMKD